MATGLARVVRLLGVAALAVLAGCDAQRIEKLEEGLATEADVRKQFGEPVTVVRLADGSMVMEYPRQPEGQTNYFITIGADGKMSALRQVLTPHNFAKVQAGMDRTQVRNLLGRPARTQTYSLKQEEVWDWRFLQDGQAKEFSVSFSTADGKVVATATRDDSRETTGGGPSGR